MHRAGGAASYCGLVPGSLIFVVIVAIWAAYLLQHWVRQREDAAATRSVHGFTDAMRVLEKRPRQPVTELTDRRGPLAAVLRRRAAPPTVDVQRPQPSTASAAAGSPSGSVPGPDAGRDLRRAKARSPLRARRAADRVPTTAEAPQMTSQHARRPVSHSSSPSQSQTQTQSQTRSGKASWPQTPASRPTVGKGQRRLRAALLLASLVWIPASVGLAITGRLMWLSVPFAVLTFAAVLFWLRTEAAADRERVARGTETRRRIRRPRRELTSDDTQVIHAEPAAAAAAGSTVGEATAQEDSAPLQASGSPATGPASAPPAASSAAYDLVAEERALRRPAAAAAPAEAAPEGTWQPVPVPRPTYALKVKAEPRLTSDGIPADVFDTPEFSDEADELDERGRFARRAANG